MRRTRVDDLHWKWLGNLGYERAYDALEEEFSFMGALIVTRSRVGLSQEEVVSDGSDWQRAHWLCDSLQHAKRRSRLRWQQFVGVNLPNAIS